MIRLPSLTQVKDQLKVTTKRFPLPTLCAAVLTGLALYLVHDDWGSNPDPWMWQSMLTAMLGLVSLAGLTLALETTKNRTRSLFMALGVALLGLYWWSLPGDTTNAGTLWIERHVFLMLGSLVALSWAPYWRLNVSNQVLWRWCTNLIGNLVVTGFFALVLFAGTAAALWSVEMLFELDIDEKFYLDLWILAAALFSPLFFLAQFDLAPTKLQAPKQVAPFMRIFTQFIMSPLAAGYLVILYSYTARVLITGEWPKNILGWLVIAFLGVSIFTYFLWTPFIEKIKSTPSKLPLSGGEIKRIFWVILIPQIFLLFIAIGWRIHAYSWTENRYFVVVLGLWLLGTTIYFLARRDAKFKWIFVALTGVILVSQLGPLSGYNVGKQSQTQRLITYLEEANIKQGDTYTKVKIDVNDEIENEIASILDYLEDHHGGDTLEQLFPGPMAEIASGRHYNRVDDLMESWGLDYRSKWERQDRYGDEARENFNYRIAYQQPRYVAGYDWRVNLNYTGETQPSVGEAGLAYHFKRSAYDQPPAITVWEGEQLLETIDLKPVIDDIRADHTIVTNKDLTPEQLFYEYESERLAAKIYFTGIYGHDDKVTNFDAEVYVRVKQ